MSALVALHFVTQFFGSRGPTDPSGHVLTTGIPSGDGVGNEVGAPDGDRTEGGAGVFFEEANIREAADALPFSQGKITGKQLGEYSLDLEHGCWLFLLL